ncbi:MAG: SDR family oxidoreductase [Prochlorococcaceae cyanobacterium MAG_34]|jgi:3-oxoacyl-[acyl-carrier protein] reductase|nr:SDR family oxidoreductase [Prochlorococcaceae cyanobacterium MAG_34]
MTESHQPSALVFGAGGALGSAIHATLTDQGFRLFTAGPAADRDARCHLQMAYDSPVADGAFDTLPPLAAVVWAQGLNCSDAITDFSVEDLHRLWQGNVVFIATTLAGLLASGRLVAGTRLAVVSSIWQLESRPGKLSYTISKAALQGLVKSCALDLGASGILINAVLPGVVDTPMTRTHLSPEQIGAITRQTALQRLAEPADIAAAVAFLVGSTNRCMTGQFLTVDGGFIGFKHA